MAEWEAAASKAGYDPKQVFKDLKAYSSIACTAICNAQSRINPDASQRHDVIVRMPSSPACQAQYPCQEAARSPLTSSRLVGRSVTGNTFSSS
jgi:hypothetical protein